MKKYLIILISLLLGTTISAQKYQLDTKNTTFNWTGYGEVGGFSQTGSIKAKSGSLLMKKDTITAAVITIDMKSMKSDNKRVANHLKDTDFFDVKKHPTAILDLRCIEDNVAKANLTIRGITHAIDIPIAILVKEDELRASGKAIIDRTLYGIKYNSSAFFKSLGNQAIKHEFDLTFEVTFTRVD